MNNLDLAAQRRSPLSLDVPVGQMTEKNLSLTISVRGHMAVLGFFNKKAGRGFEVAFSPEKVGELRELLAEAERKVPRIRSSVVSAS